MRLHTAGIAQGLERLTVAEEAAGSRPAIRPNFNSYVARNCWKHTLSEGTPRSPSTLGRSSMVRVRAL
jgi:hypothetical protein